MQMAEKLDDPGGSSWEMAVSARLLSGSSGDSV